MNQSMGAKSRAVVLLSGGLDSATVMAIVDSQGFDITAVTAFYGQRHGVELECARRIAAKYHAEHLELSLPIGQLGGSSLTDNSAIPKDRHESEMESAIPSTYVPARNTVMLALALAVAETRQSHDIFCGVNAVDYSGYPDCRPEFVQKFEELANLATKMGVEGERIRIHAPLMKMRKPEIIETGLRLGVDYRFTHSCYDPTSAGRPCEHCDSCLIRIKAFASLGMTDPALDIAR